MKLCHLKFSSVLFDFFGLWIIISDFGTFELARLEPVLVEIALHPFPALIDLFKHQTIQEAGLAGIKRFSKISNFDFITFCNVYVKSDKGSKYCPTYNSQNSHTRFALTKM